MIEIQEEDLTPELALELGPVMQVHGQDVYAKWHSPEPLVASPQIRDYFLMRDAGVLQICTARLNGIIVGYSIAVIEPHPHVGDTYCKLEAVYIAQELRKSVYSQQILEYTVGRAAERGASFVYFGVPFRLADALSQKGWVPEEVGMVKYL